MTTGGVHLKSDPPFDIRNRTGDTSYREISSETRFENLALSHPGYNTKDVSQDINTIFPLERLRDFRDTGVIAELTVRHFSFMGYMPQVERLLNETGPEVAEKLKEDGADLVILVPA